MLKMGGGASEGPTPIFNIESGLIMLKLGKRYHFLELTEIELDVEGEIYLQKNI